MLLSVIAFFELVSVSLMQTEKIRQDISEDMSILRAFSIVFERRPDLRFNEMNYIKIVYSTFMNFDILYMVY